jgi:hypothetical protein
MDEKEKSFEENRQSLLVQMTAEAGCKCKEKTIPFRNDDVPKFLARLDEYEELSRKSQIIIT